MIYCEYSAARRPREGPTRVIARYRTRTTAELRGTNVLPVQAEQAGQFC